MSDIATTFVETLAARGVTLRVRGKKDLAMIPKRAYGEMSADERQTLKQHKAAIIAVVREGKYATTTVEPKAAAPVEPPAPCAYCYQSPTACAKLREERPDVFYALHPLEAQKRADERLNKEFRLAFGMDRWPRI